MPDTTSMFFKEPIDICADKNNEVFMKTQLIFKNLETLKFHSIFNAVFSTDKIINYFFSEYVY